MAVDRQPVDCFNADFSDQLTEDSVCPGHSDPVKYLDDFCKTLGPKDGSALDMGLRVEFSMGILSDEDMTSTSLTAPQPGPNLLGQFDGGVILPEIPFAVELATQKSQQLNISYQPYTQPQPSDFSLLVLDAVKQENYSIPQQDISDWNDLYDQSHKSDIAQSPLKVEHESVHPLDRADLVLPYVQTQSSEQLQSLLDGKITGSFVQIKNGIQFQRSVQPMTSSADHLQLEASQINGIQLSNVQMMQPEEAKNGILKMNNVQMMQPEATKNGILKMKNVQMIQPEATKNGILKMNNVQMTKIDAAQKCMTQLDKVQRMQRGHFSHLPFQYPAVDKSTSEIQLITPQTPDLDDDEDLIDNDIGRSLLPHSGEKAKFNKLVKEVLNKSRDQLPVLSADLVEAELVAANLESSEELNKVDLNQKFSMQPVIYIQFVKQTGGAKTGENKEYVGSVKKGKTKNAKNISEIRENKELVGPVKKGKAKNAKNIQDCPKRPVPIFPKPFTLPVVNPMMSNNLSLSPCGQIATQSMLPQSCAAADMPSPQRLVDKVQGVQDFFVRTQAIGQLPMRFYQPPMLASPLPHQPSMIASQTTGAVMMPLLQSTAAQSPLSVEEHNFMQLLNLLHLQYQPKKLQAPQKKEKLHRNEPYPTTNVGKARRQRTVFTEYQTFLLSGVFRKYYLPSEEQKKVLADRLELPYGPVSLFFQNRRAEEVKRKNPPLARAQSVSPQNVDSMEITGSEW